jgi:proteasome lid subunit RPN8/RPN11
MSVLRLAVAAYQAIRVHGEQSYPEECCGVLLGEPGQDGWLVRAAIPARNADAGSRMRRYSIAAEELVRIESEARRLGLAIAGFYHSHPDHPAKWSATDFAEAHWLGCSYVITEVAEGKATVTNSFLLTGSTEEDKHFEQETIRVEDQASPNRSQLSPG